MAEPVSPPPAPDDLPLAPAPPRALPEVPSMLMDATQIKFDLPCVRCGYNLFGLPRNHNCPECGRPIADSFRGDRLDFSQPAWVYTLACGALILTVAEAAYAVTIVLALGRSAQVLLLTVAGTGLMHAAGVWFLTSRPPVAADPGSQRFAPWARAAELGALAAQVLLIACPNEYVLALVFAAAGASSLAMGFHLRLLARRIPNDFLAATALNGGWAAAIAMGIVAVAMPFFGGFVGLMFFLCFPPPAIFAILLRFAVPLLLMIDLFATARLAEKNRS